MSVNRYMGQLKGPFNANNELMIKIKEDAEIDVSFVKHLGVQTDVGYSIFISPDSLYILPNCLSWYSFS